MSRPAANRSPIRSLSDSVAVAVRHAANLGVHLALAGLTPRFPVFWWRGMARTSGRAATLLVAGKEPWVHYLPGRFFEGQSERERIGSFSIWTLPGLLRRLRSSADLTIARMDLISARLFFGGDYLRVPEWVFTDMAVPDDLEAHARSGRDRKGDARRIRRMDLRPVVSHDKRDFYFFYHKMHLPYIRARFGELAYVANEASWRRRFQRGGILWVERDHQRLAGLFFEVRQDVFHSIATGAVDASAQLRHDGVLAATYLYELDCARQLGCNRIDYGGSRPSLHDGPLRYKHKWGATLSKQSNHPFDLLVHWNRPDGVVADFLSHMSLIFRDEGGFSGLGALKTNRPATADDAAKARHTLWMNGLRRLYLFNADGWEDGLTPPQGVIPLDARATAPFPWRSEAGSSL